jgi:GGDEF domain-containing protein
MERSQALENYMAAIRGVAAYAPKLSENSDGAHSPERGYLLAMAAEVANGDRLVLEESRSFLRCVLREYRDESAAYLAQLRQELSATAGTLRDVSCSLTEADAKGDTHFNTGLAQLSELALDPSAASCSAVIREASRELEGGFAEMRRQHQLIVSQLHTEIRLLNKRMEALTGANLDDLSRLMPRDEIEDRIAVAGAGSFCCLTLKANGLVRAQDQHGSQVFKDLLIAFTRRMRNTLPADTPAGRWNEDGFVAILFAGPSYARELAEVLQRRLSGPYICRSGAKTVISSLRTLVSVVESGAKTRPERILESVNHLL